jgi:hypothetical protein
MALFTESLRQVPGATLAEDQRRLLLRLSGYRITGQRAEQLIKNYADEAIIEGLNAADAWMEAKEQRRESIANPAGVAYKAITEGWRAPVENLPRQSKNTQRRLSGRGLLANPRRLEELRIAFRRHWYADYIDTRSKGELDTLRAGFEQSLGAETNNAAMLNRLRKHGLSGIVLGLFHRYLSEQGIEPGEDDFQRFLHQRKPKRMSSVRRSHKPAEIHLCSRSETMPRSMFGRRMQRTRANGSPVMLSPDESGRGE